jgi:lipopolysaccharide transport protein LptA
MAATHDAKAPINLEAASSDFDYKNNTLLFRRVRITQGEMQVEAQEASATGLNFENSEWNLKGQVRITVPDGKLASDVAAVTFRNNEIVKAVIRGGPATFEQRLEQSRQLAQGRANSIEYDVGASTVRLLGAAWLSDGQNEIRGNTLVYDIGRQRVAANPDESDPGGVRITINPKETTPPADSPQEPGP